LYIFCKLVPIFSYIWEHFFSRVKKAFYNYLKSLSSFFCLGPMLLMLFILLLLKFIMLPVWFLIYELKIYCFSLLCLIYVLKVSKSIFKSLIYLDIYFFSSTNNFGNNFYESWAIKIGFNISFYELELSIRVLLFTYCFA